MRGQPGVEGIHLPVEPVKFLTSVWNVAADNVVVFEFRRDDAPLIVQITSFLVTRRVGQAYHKQTRNIKSRQYRKQPTAA